MNNGSSDHLTAHDQGGQETYWESVANQTRWGRNISERKLKVLQTAMKMLPVPGRALEVGCEGGYWSEILYKRGWKLFCSDISKESLETCKSRMPEAECVQVSVADTTLTVESGTMKFLLCLEVFPVVHSDWFVKEAARVLETSGLLMAVAQNRHSVRGCFVFLRDALLFRKTPWYRESYHSWRTRLVASGFEVVHEEGFCWFPFARTSNSPLIPLCTKIEKLLGLARWVTFSPWSIVIARKRQ